MLAVLLALAFLALVAIDLRRDSLIDPRPVLTHPRWLFLGILAASGQIGMLVSHSRQIVDRESSQPSLAPTHAVLERQQVSGLLHQRLVGHCVDPRQAVKHVGRGLVDLPILELAQVGVRDRLARRLFDLPE